MPNITIGASVIVPCGLRGTVLSIANNHGEWNVRFEDSTEARNAFDRPLYGDLVRPIDWTYHEDELQPVEDESDEPNPLDPGVDRGDAIIFRRGSVGNRWGIPSFLLLNGAVCYLPSAFRDISALSATDVNYLTSGELFWDTDKEDPSVLVGTRAVAVLHCDSLTVTEVKA